MPKSGLVYEVIPPNTNCWSYDPEANGVPFRRTYILIMFSATTRPLNVVASQQNSAFTLKLLVFIRADPQQCYLVSAVGAAVDADALIFVAEGEIATGVAIASCDAVAAAEAGRVATRAVVVQAAAGAARVRANCNIGYISESTKYIIT